MVTSGQLRLSNGSKVSLAEGFNVEVPAVVPAWYVRALDSAAGLWALAFAIYLVIYVPWLTRTRLDGKDG